MLCDNAYREYMNLGRDRAAAALDGDDTEDFVRGHLTLDDLNDRVQPGALDEAMAAAPWAESWELSDAIYDGVYQAWAEFRREWAE